MKKVKLLFLSLMMTMVMVVLLGCEGEKKETKQTHEVTIEVTTDKGKNKIAKENVKVKDGENLFDVMKDNFKIEAEKGMITSINHKQQDNKKYWMFDINKEPAMKGAKDIKLKDGDIISWDLHEIK
ncbi:hypothetical protein CQZ94_30460 [Bacillus sp. MYb209]|uniref:DUF4430 domain-containing protein n=1 Tax=Bacillus sp. MYb209 TaxID=1848605 RepID=UPI000CFB3BAD|nr:DUF4430 domain-containing protein [Bacillus sp. MYb209]PQZ40008.1 hypothetical protein CQZ94_30460 [Bacillus sp. MYb209]